MRIVVKLLNKKDIKLVSTARKLVKKAYIRNGKIVSDVVSIIITDKGNSFYGVDIENLHPGSGICAETSAISNMILAGKGKSKIITALALYDYGPKYKKEDYKILPPCKKCRINLRKFGNPWVFISKTEKEKL